MPVDAPAGSYEVAGIPAAQRQQQIRALQAEITALETEKARIQALIDQYHRRFRQQFGELLRQIIQLQGHLATRRAGQSRRRSDAEVANDYPARYEQTQRKLEEALAHTPAEPDATAAADLRHLYRRAVSLAHPDRFAGDPDREARATEVRIQLTAAYQREDTEAVQQLLDDLQDGLPFLDLPGAKPDAPALERMLARLTQSRNALALELAILHNSENYRIMTDDQLDLTAHFTQLEQRCLNQIELLMNQLG